MAGKVVVGEVIPPRKKHRAQMRSLRELMADIRSYRAACDRGEISSADAQRRVAMVKDEGELILAQKLLEVQGQGDAVDVMPDESYTAPQIQPHRTKKVTSKIGTGRHGETIDEKTVSVTSSHAGDDVETAAQIEALT